MRPSRSASSFAFVRAAGSTFRKSLTAHGDQILGEHESIDALTALIHGEDLGELADNDAMLSVSVDAIVRPTGLLGGLLGGVLKLAVGLVNTVVEPSSGLCSCRMEPTPRGQRWRRTCCARRWA